MNLNLEIIADILLYIPLSIFLEYQENNKGGTTIVLINIVLILICNLDSNIKNLVYA